MLNQRSGNRLTYGGLVNLVRVGAMAAVAMTLLAACGDSDSSSPTAEEQVCSAEAALSASVDQVAEDVKALNLGQAKDGWQSVRDDAAQLLDAVGGLASETQSELKPLVEELQTTVSSVTDATSLEELGSTLDSAEQQLNQIVSTATTSLDCPAP
jgi:hypothetical protein